MDERSTCYQQYAGHCRERAECRTCVLRAAIVAKPSARLEAPRICMARCRCNPTHTHTIAADLISPVAVAPWFSRIHSAT
jgi:hypothetical protein